MSLLHFLIVGEVIAQNGVCVTLICTFLKFHDKPQTTEVKPIQILQCHYMTVILSRHFVISAAEQGMLGYSLKSHRIHSLKHQRVDCA